MQLISAFVFTYAKCGFSDDDNHLVSLYMLQSFSEKLSLQQYPVDLRWNILAQDRICTQAAATQQMKADFILCLNRYVCNDLRNFVFPLNLCQISFLCLCNTFKFICNVET